MGLFYTSAKIFGKDFKSELRNRYVINSLLMFVLVTISIIKFSIGDEKIDGDILSGLLWIVIFFAAISGLARVFIKEEEKETSFALKLSVDPISIFLGKLFFNLALTFFINIFIFVLFVLITSFEIKNFTAFVIIVALGNTGMVSASTIIAAIISKANTKGTLYPVLAFPVMLPLLITVINATKLASAGADTYSIFSEYQILFSYAVVVTTVSLLLFRFVWED